MRDLTEKMICPLVFSALAAVVSRRETLVFVDHHDDDEYRGTREDIVAEFEGR